MKRFLLLVLCAALALSLCSCAPTSSPVNAGAPDNSNPIVSQDAPPLDVVFEEVIEQLPKNLVMTEYEGTVSDIWDEDGLTCFSIHYTYQNEQGAYIGESVTFGLYPNEYFETTVVNPDIKLEDRVKVNSFTYNGVPSQKYPSADIITVIPKQGTTFYALVLNVNGNNIFAEGLSVGDLNHDGLFNFSVDEDTEIIYHYAPAELSKIQPGDIIAVTSTGSVLEMYPSYYTKVTEIAYLRSADEVPLYDPLIGASEVEKTFTSRVNWVYKHNGRIHLGMYDDFDDYCEVVLPEGYKTDAQVGDTVTVTVDSRVSGREVEKYSAQEVLIALSDE